MQRTISNDDWKVLALRLNLDVPTLKAVAAVESAGEGFLPAPSDLPKVLFEGHVFHRLTRGRHDELHPDLSHPKWDRTRYAKTSLGEWKRLEAACVIDRTAALQAASWGAFQIMGFNYAACGYSDVESFVRSQKSGAPGQLEAFARFIDRPGFLLPLRKRDWAGFAKLYNGPGFALNHYDTKLARAYARYKAEAETVATGTRASAAGRKGLDSLQVKGRPQVALLPPRGQTGYQRTVKPDPVDLRDWVYRPNVARAPAPDMLPNNPRPTSDQKSTQACTGFGLATVIEYLLDRADRAVESISGYMLYSMARRYDEWDDDERQDLGSSLRGALRGWSQHGASRADLWAKLGMPAATFDENDWWLDAVKRPLGAYYRLSTDVIADIHSALQDVGAVYASAYTHAGWLEQFVDVALAPPTSQQELSLIRHHAGERNGGHAFAIVGYNEDGFVIQNSWGRKWGRGGFAVLSYADWRANAMDCWVCQLGVVTAEHRAVASATTLRMSHGQRGTEEGYVAAAGSAGQVILASNPALATHEISPFVVDMENEGKLSDRGLFRTSPDDLRLLVSHYLPEACAAWKIGAGDTLDVAIYAHGGLVNEQDAAATARRWIPLLYSQRIFPVFLMWETGALQTFLNLIDDAVSRDRDRSGGVFDKLRDMAARWIDERIEGIARRPGGALWRQMKDNAEKMSRLADSGVVQLFEMFQAANAKGTLPTIRLHLIGHSAGAIVHSYLGNRAVQQKLEIGSINLLAPAARLDLFDLQLGSLIEKKGLPVLIAHLTDSAELNDDTCKPYGHSLLYLVSRSFEDRNETHILGMERHLLPAIAASNWGAQVRRLATPGFAYEEGGALSTATSHGGLDDDPVIQEAVITHIKGR